MPFGLQIQVDPRNHMLGGGPDIRREMGNLGEGISHWIALGLYNLAYTPTKRAL